jgi:hypothetical protein
VGDGMTWTPSGLFQRLTNAENPESPKAAVLITSAWTLAGVAAALGAACAIRIIIKGDVGSGAVSALVAACVPLAGLAGWHSQQDPKIGLAGSVSPGGVSPGIEPGGCARAEKAGG